MNLALQFNVFKNPSFWEEGFLRHLFDGRFPSKQSKLLERLLVFRSNLYLTAQCWTRGWTRWLCVPAAAESYLWQQSRKEERFMEGKSGCRSRSLEGKSPSKRCYFSLLPPFLPKHWVLNRLNWTAKFTNAYLYNLEMPKKWFPYTPFSKTDGSFKTIFG